MWAVDLRTRHTQIDQLLFIHIKVKLIENRREYKLSFKRDFYIFENWYLTIISYMTFYKVGKV